MSPKLRAPLSSLLDDPIAHDRLERVRRRIATTRRLPPNERAWRWAPAMALVLVVAAIAAVWRWTAPGELREPDALASGATFELARGGRVDLPDGSSLTLSPATRVELIESDAGHVLLAQGDGRVTYDIRPGGPRRWSIEAGPLTVDVIGTRFTIMRAGGHVRVDVGRGRVRVRGDQALRTLGAGESIEVGATPPAADGALAAVAEPVVAPPAPPPRAARPPAPALPHWRELAARGLHDEAFVTLGEQGLRDTAERATSVDELLVLADTARLSGHPASAITPLRRIVDAHPDDARAGFAALTAGRLSLDVLDAPEAAVDLLERALALGVGPRLHDTALARLAEAYRRSGRASAARETAERYLREHPNGVQAPNMRELASSPE